jgi:hypothetical protein
MLETYSQETGAAAVNIMMLVRRINVFLNNMVAETIQFTLWQ